MVLPMLMRQVVLQWIVLRGWWYPRSDHRAKGEAGAERGVGILSGSVQKNIR
jgi:hypothetical protein